MITSKLIHALDDVQRMYGDMPVRVDLGLETVHKAFDIDYVVHAQFPTSEPKQALVIFTAWEAQLQAPDHRAKTMCSELARELTGWYNLCGDLVVRADLGFFKSGLCYDIETLNIGTFSSENNTRALVIYPKSSLPKVNVSAN